MAVMVNVITKLPKSYLIALGDIAVNWATLEWNVERIIWLLLNLGPKEGRIVTVPMSMKPKLETLTLLVERRVKNEKYRNNVIRFCKAVTLTSDSRNKVTHGVWARLPSKPRSFFVIWARGAGKNRILPQRFAMTAKKLEEIKHLIVGHNIYASAIRQTLSTEQNS